MIQTIPGLSFSSQQNKNNSTRFISLTTEDDLEYRLSVASCPGKMEDVTAISNTQDFHRVFPHLSRKCQHLFRLLQNWSYLECFPSQTLLAKMIKCTRKHVNFLLKILDKIGFIKKHYRHRKTCLYFVRDFIGNLGWGDTKKALQKKAKVTHEVTPSSRTSNNSIVSINNGGKKKKIPPDRSDPKIEPPTWLPKWPMIKERFPQLAREIFADKEIYTNLAAFNENAVHRALESLEYAQNKNNYIKTTHAKYLFGSLNKLVEKKDRNWSFAMSLRK